jgi:hypothetical protein
LKLGTALDSLNRSVGNASKLNGTFGDDVDMLFQFFRQFINSSWRAMKFDPFTFQCACLVWSPRSIASDSRAFRRSIISVRTFEGRSFLVFVIRVQARNLSATAFLSSKAQWFSKVFSAHNVNRNFNSRQDPGVLTANVLAELREQPHNQFSNP